MPSGAEERRVAGGIHMQCERRTGDRRAKRLQVRDHHLCPGPGIGDREGAGLPRVRHVDDRVARRRGQQGVAAACRAAVLVPHREGTIHRLQRIDQSGTLLIGRRAEIGCRAHDDLLDPRRRGIGVAVRAAVGLDHQRGLARRQRCRLAGATEMLDRRWRISQVCTPGVEARIGGAERPSRVTGRYHIHRARTSLRETARAEGRDIVVEIAAASQHDRTVAGLRVEAELGTGTDADHRRVGGGRSEGPCRPRVAAAGHHRYPGLHRRIVGERRGVVGIVRQGVAAERLV